MKTYVLFYGNQVFGEYDSWKEIRKELFPHTEIQTDVYNGGYVYVTTTQEWFRCDHTPSLIEDVPKQLQMLALVLNI
jgi:hypothetical protein